MKNKLETLGFIAAMVLWFAFAVGTLLQLNVVADNAVAIGAQGTPAPAAVAKPASAPAPRFIATQAGADVSSSAM